MTRWIFVRHGQSVANAEGWMSGHVDVPLTDVGVAQARALQASLARQRIVRVVSSDLSRAALTAHLALGARGHGLREHAALRERDLGDWTRRSITWLESTGARDELDRLDGRPPGGESLREVAERAAQLLVALDDGRPTLVAAHGGLIRALVSFLDAEVDDPTVARRYVPNAAPIVRDLPIGTWERVLARTQR